nr:unnamed protein product [Digitaria exilis]
MAPALWFFLFSSVWVALSVLSMPTAAEDGQGRVHCRPVLCGNVNISFPFGLVSDPGDAAVRCRNNIPYLGYYQTEQNMQILSIFYGNDSLLIAYTGKAEGLNMSSPRGCQSLAANITSELGPPFSISPMNQNLIL